MEERINNILSQLASAMEAQNATALEREKTHRAQMAKLAEVLSAAVTLCSANDNEFSSASFVHAEPQPTKRAPRVNGTRIEDCLLLNALTSEWINAGKLRQVLLSRDIKIGEGTVYNRMRKLASERPDEIESAMKPERWRLRTSGKARKPAAKQVNAAAKPQGDSLSLVSSTPLSLVSPTTEVHRPVLHHGDCLEVMKTLPDDSIDLILADLPYGTTGLAIDKPLPLDQVWAEYRRILRKPHGNIVLFGSQPFTTALINSAPDIFRYPLVWEKTSSTGYQHADSKPLKKHEDILVFSYGVNISAKRTERRAIYNDQQAVPVRRKAKGCTKVTYLHKAVRGYPAGHEYIGSTNCQTSILKFPKDTQQAGQRTHPFAKPVPLLEHLIRTYSDPGEIVLDNTMGSGGTCIAAMSSGRQSIGIEKDGEWFEVAAERVELAHKDMVLAAPVKPIVPITASAERTIYQGDCLEVMKTLPSGSVDLVVTSPPYNLALSQRSGMKKSKKSSLWHNAPLADGYATFDDAMPHEEYVAWMRNVLGECWRLLADDGAIFMNHKPRIQKGELWVPLELNPDLPVRQIVVWDRGSGFNFNRSFFTPSHEWVVIFAKPNFRFSKGKMPRDVWHFPPARNNDHPAPFPVELPMTAIEHTSARVVLDPFMGSGTTGVAAMRCGRTFVGIELDQGYCEAAATRIAFEAAGEAA